MVKCHYLVTYSDHMCKNIWLPKWPAVCKTREDRKKTQQWETKRERGQSGQSDAICWCASILGSSGTSKEANVLHTVTFINANNRRHQHAEMIILRLSLASFSVLLPVKAGIYATVEDYWYWTTFWIPEMTGMPSQAKFGAKPYQ